MNCPENVTPWGQHLVLDFKGCPTDLLACKDNIAKWSKDLVEAIDMVAYGDPIIEHFATHSYESGGYTLLQMIETSNIAAHFAENIGEVYIDIFSCKCFDNQIALDVCKKYFAPEMVNQTVLSRGVFGMAQTLSPSSDTGVNEEAAGGKHVRAA